MKNYLLVLLAAMGFPFCTQAQQVMSNEGGLIPDVPQVHTKFNRPAQRASIVSEWYNYGQAIYDMGGNVNFFRNFLFPDSTVQVEFSSGMGYVWKHSIGEVLDPSSTIFTTIGQTQVENHIPYTLDSIAVPYRYWRYQNAAPDTLVVQVYMEPAIRLEPTPGWSSSASYASVDYDYTKRIGKNETLMIKHPLTAADTSTLTQGVLEFPVNLNIPAGKKVAATVTYFPGNSYNVNDTIDTYATFPIHNRVNAFVMYDFRDNDMGYEPLYYNNELTVTTDVRYNFNTNNWNGNYIPGTAWLSGIYYGHIYFKLSFDTDFVGVNEISNVNEVRVYPNPTTGTLYLAGRTSIVQAEVKDLDGKTVLSENGAPLTQVNTAVLSNGVYVLSLKNAEGQVLHQRFVKQ